MTTDSVQEDELGVVGVELDGRYRIDRLLGAGTMGSVYEGTQLAVGRRVAIKILHSTLKTHPEVRKRFRLEAQAIASLNHPNCVTLYDFGYSEQIGALYMVIEYLEGETLEAHLAVGLDSNAALSVAQQIADVLAQAHEAGILHRDLKPENVMIVEGADGSFVAKVLDFGLARIFEDAATGTRLTRQGQLFGTPAYMSPEQCGGALDVGPEADVYALGISLYEMLTGRLPFESDNVADLLVKHATHPPPELPAVAPDEIVELVAQMLSKSPAARPTARYVASTLKGFIGHTSAVPARTGRSERPRNPQDATASIPVPAGASSDTLPPNLHGRTRTVGIIVALGAVLLAAAAIAALAVIDPGRASGSTVEISEQTEPEAVEQDKEYAETAHAAIEAPDDDDGDGTASDAPDDARQVAGATTRRAGLIAGEMVTPPKPPVRAKAPRNEAARPAAAPRPARAKGEPGEDATKKTQESGDEPDSPGFRKLEFSY